MSVELLPILMVVGLLTLIFVGYPVAFVLGGLSVYFMIFSGMDLIFFQNIASRMLGASQDWLLLSVPVFIFMGVMLDKSCVASKLLYSLDQVLGGMPGGLAVSVVLFGTIMAASTGIIGASVVMLGLIALPVMLREKYDPHITGGVVAASGILGILIPPSIMLVMFSSLLQVPVGDLFKGVLIPSAILVSMYLVFVIILGFLRPNLMPRRGPEMDAEANAVGVSVIVDLLKNLLPPLALILAVLGSIFAGIATPTEGASVGALSAILLTIANRKMNKKILTDTVIQTSLMTGMCLFIALCAPAFSAVFREIGGTDMLKNALIGSEFSPYALLCILMTVIFVLGFFMEWLEISYILLPMFAGIVSSLDFGLGLTPVKQLTWFAVLVAINLQTSFLTPPFGMALFYVKGVAPKGLSMRHLYLGSIPFVLLQLLTLIVVLLFPGLVV
jgi:tripartite ATP-independent transporter DctM subunit